jgi:hypothetical protein
MAKDNEKRDPIWMPKKTLAQHLTISIRTIENRVSDGTLIPHYFGGLVFFDKNEVDAAIASGRFRKKKFRDGDLK